MNIIFDLGGVILNWDPDAIIRKLFSEPSLCQRIRSEIFEHPDWLELDRGTLDPGEAMSGFAARSGINLIDIKQLMHIVPESLTPIPGSLDLIRQVKARGHSLFCLSNMHQASFSFLAAEYTFWNIFSGIVISAHVKMIKPDPAIYLHLLDKYDLAPGETIFVDDMPVNLAAADRLGIQTILFKNPKDCERLLLLINDV
jgi:putative hydrolase of the HAD superfamily